MKNPNRTSYDASRKTPILSTYTEEKPKPETKYCICGNKTDQTDETCETCKLAETIATELENKQERGGTDY